jgi:hypothetical protein
MNTNDFTFSSIQSAESGGNIVIFHRDYVAQDQCGLRLPKQRATKQQHQISFANIESCDGGHAVVLDISA